MNFNPRGSKINSNNQINTWIYKSSLNKQHQKFNKNSLIEFNKFLFKNNDLKFIIYSSNQTLHFANILKK